MKYLKCSNEGTMFNTDGLCPQCCGDKKCACCEEWKSELDNYGICEDCDMEDYEENIDE